MPRAADVDVLVDDDGGLEFSDDSLSESDAMHHKAVAAGSSHAKVAFRTAPSGPCRPRQQSISDDIHGGSVAAADTEPRVSGM